MDRIALEHRVVDAERVAKYWCGEAMRLKADNARRLAALKARRLRKLAPWWKLGCEEIDASDFVHSNETLIEDIQFEFGTRVSNCLKYMAPSRGGSWVDGKWVDGPEVEPCKTVGQVRELSDAELMRTPNFGKVSLAELREVIWRKRGE